MPDIDLLLAILHHLAVFTLVGILAAEFALLRPGLAGPRLNQLVRIDGAYGGVAGLVIVAGFLRVFFGASGPEYYLTNWVFWSKIGAFLGVGLLSIRPTMAILGWSRKAEADPDYVPPATEIAALRPVLYAQIGLLALIPIFAAAMARGYGL